MSKRRREGRSEVDEVQTVSFTGDVTFTRATVFSSVLTPILNTPSSTLTVGGVGKTINFNGSTITNFNDTGNAPPGAVVDYAGAAAPTGWLLCNGASITTASQPGLFAAIGYTYGGAGANFNVPDCRGRTTIGVGLGAGLTNRVLAAVGGFETVTLIESQMPMHQHFIQVENGAAAPQSSGANAYLADSGANQYSGAIVSPANMATDVVTFTGGNAPHENMMPFIALNKIIKT